MAMNTRYNATLFILQQECVHTDTHVYKCDTKHITKTIVFTYYKITIKKGVNTGVNYNQLYTFTVNNIMQVSI